MLNPIPHTLLHTILHTTVIDSAAKAHISAEFSVANGADLNWDMRHDCIVLTHRAPLDHDRLHPLRLTLPFDINPLPATFDPKQIRLLISDMDSTLIAIECIDEIADFMQIKDKVSRITEAAMRGEMDFTSSLRQRVGLLANLDQSVLERVYQERLRLNPGAEILIAGLKARGIKIALVSGGFTFFTDRLHQRLALDFSLANVLNIEAGRLTGKVEGDVVTGERKQAYLQQLCRQLGITAQQTIAVGDGANDLKMLQYSGLGIAYRAKPVVQAEADVALNHSGLDAILQLLIDAQGGFLG